MKKDVGWKSFFEDNHRYADVINGIGCNGKQFVKDSDLSVKQYLENNNSSVKALVRYEVGEGMEKRNDNFAEEVRSQLNN